MATFLVEGGHPLRGRVRVSGSKNAALPILAATLMSDQKSIIRNVPDIEDVYTMLRILEALGAKVEFQNHIVAIQTHRLKNKFLSEDYVGRMRASILLLGPLLARFHDVRMSYPGGCLLGKRPLDTHIYALEKLNAKIAKVNSELHIRVSRLQGAKLTMPEMSVTGTENVIMAAVLAKGTTEIRLAAAEPHVQDLCKCLNRMGAKIKGISTHHLIIDGVKKLKGADYAITGDYLEAGTLAVGAIVTGGDLLIEGIDPVQLDSFWQKFDELGVDYSFLKSTIHIRPSKSLRAVKMLRTAVFPSFPTDLQAPFAIALTQANGVSKVFETLFDGRLNYLFELEKMGAKIEILNPHQAIIIGPTKLKGVPILSCDIRAGAAMVLAALAASGSTEISNIHYIDRGYEKLDEKLRKLGAKIERL